MLCSKREQLVIALVDVSDKIRVAESVSKVGDPLARNSLLRSLGFPVLDVNIIAVSAANTGEVVRQHPLAQLEATLHERA